MPRTDSLMMGAIRVFKFTKTGSAKTRYNHLRETKRFTETLRKLGFGVQRWKNISNKHVGAVVQHWKNKGLAVTTIKEYLSGVRCVARFYKNDRIHQDNSAFGIENRVYVSNKDRSVDQAVYERVVSTLKTSADINNNRVAAQLQLQRELGLRKEEAFKFDPKKALLKDGTVLIQHGTKGGQQRIIHKISDKGKEAIVYAKSVLSGKNTIPNGMTERQWERRFYSTLHTHGLSKKSCGASSHGLRRAHAQERYEQVTGFEPRCKFESREAFTTDARAKAGQAWIKLDQDADVVSQYLGSSCK